MNHPEFYWMRAEVDLRHQFTEAQREDLKDILQERLKGIISSREMIDRMRKRMEAWGALDPKPQPVLKMLPPISSDDRQAAVSESETRAHALSILIAESASQDEEVRRFRGDVLNDKLLELDQVEPWIEDQAQVDKGAGRSSRLLQMVPVPPEHNIRPEQNSYCLDPPLTLEALTPPATLHIKTLEYLVPGDEWVRRVPVAIGGALERLQIISERLAQNHRWHPAQATLFVLTGAAPLISILSVEVQPTNRGVITGPSRIALTVDPMVPPEKVRASYERIRQKIVGKGHREMRERQFKLAVFTKLSPEEEPWAERVAKWNEMVPDKLGYRSTSNFKRDAERAVERLLNPFTYDAMIGLGVE
jgi:hypothetical protein